MKKDDFGQGRYFVPEITAEIMGVLAETKDLFYFLPLSMAVQFAGVCRPSHHLSPNGFFPSNEGIESSPG